MATTAAVDTTFESSSSGPQNTRQDTPTTPRPAPAVLSEPSNVAVRDDSKRTPVPQGFEEQGSQTGLLDAPTTPGRTVDRTEESTPSLKRDISLRSPPPQTPPAGLDVEMADGDDDVGVEDDGSDDDSITSESQRPSKKKKGQRFFCTEFPPCQLSFTRSEHLARHIRKHTGERPFQCHCSRRFSRLDNLRQHAQTVHLNEEIPGDSLAATSTRFQRQIRTDRVRPPTNRSRASTLSSNGGHSRGHSRNLSTSSMASTTSSVGTPEDTRRRPQPLAMANDPSARARLSLETYNNNIMASPQNQYAYYNQSPSGFSSPTSTTTFSVGASSPRFQSGIASPVSTISRSSYYAGPGQARRMSGPPGPNPFQNQPGNTYPPPMYFTPMPLGSPGAVFPQNSSVFASPTTSVFSHGRRDSETDMDLRRRTWHPSTYSSYMTRPPTSGLSYQQTPDDHRPAASEQSAASQVTRLPGIESFDHAPRPGSRQASEAIASEGSPRPPRSARPSDAGLHQNLTRLDIAAANAPAEGQWQSAQPYPHPVSQGHTGEQPLATVPQQGQASAAPMPESPVTPRKNKRQAWYGGPVTGPITPGSTRQATHRPSPEDSGSSDGVPTPGTSQGIEYHPVIVNPNGTAETYPNATVPSDERKTYTHPADQSHHQTYALQSGHDPRLAAGYSQPANNDMDRLEALVAVATSENRAAEQRS